MAGDKKSSYLYRNKVSELSGWIDVEKAISAVIGIYDRNVFQQMRVDWRTYPSNIGHKNWPGCFRCHDGKHISKNGKVLSMECTLCHTIPVRGPLELIGRIDKYITYPALAEFYCQKFLALSPKFASAER